MKLCAADAAVAGPSDERKWFSGGTAFAQDKTLSLSCGGCAVFIAVCWVLQSLPPRPALGVCSPSCSLSPSSPPLPVQTRPVSLPQSCIPASFLWLLEPATPNSVTRQLWGRKCRVGVSAGQGLLGAPSSPASRVACLPWLCPHISLTSAPRSHLLLFWVIFCLRILN